LHCLLLNAGLYEPLNDLSADGYGYAMAVNHLAGYYLNTLLLDRLERTAKQLSKDDLFGVRVVYVASESHRLVGFAGSMTPEQMTEQVLFDKRERGAIPDMKHYGSTKLCNIWTAAYMKRQCESKGIRYYSLHPGAMIRTNIATTKTTRFLFWIMSPFTKSIQQGAATSVYCATATELKDFGSGCYHMDCYIKESTPLSHNEALQKRLIELSDAAIEKAMRPK